MNTRSTRGAARQGAGLIDKSVSAIDDRISELTDQVADLTARLARAAGSGADVYGGRMGRLAGQAADYSWERLGEASKGAMALERRLERTVRRHPIETVGIAIGIGCLLALIVRPR